MQPTLRDTAIATFRRRFGRAPSVIVRAPGRVNLLGGHVDYQEGWVLPAAVDRAVWLAAGERPGASLRLEAIDLAEGSDEALDALPPPRAQRHPDPSSPDWRDFPRGVAWAMREAGLSPCGVDAAYTSNVPVGAGVSSSAAVEVAFLLAWDHLGSLGLDRIALARLGRRAENGYVGVGSGIMDQFASLHGRAGHALLLDCRSLAHQPLPLPTGTAVLVADSGVQRSLAGSGFDDRRASCETAIAQLRLHLPEARTLRDVSLEQWELHSHRLVQPLRRRARHVVTECARVLAGADALRRGDAAALGYLMRLSHLSSRDDYEVSTPELDLLAAAAWAAPGCLGARLAGGGFGGCINALVEEAALPAVGAAIGDAFRRAFGREPATFVCRAAEGAEVMPL